MIIAEILTSYKDIIWLMICSFLVFLMQYGFLLLETGLVREKNNINVALKNLADFAISLLGFWIFGFAFMYGSSFEGWIGTSSFFFDSNNVKTYMFFIFNASFAVTFATIISGGVVERMKFSAYLIVVIISIFFYPIFGHWVWSDMGIQVTGSPNELKGWLAQLGLKDFAGGLTLHAGSGFVALALMIILKPRKDFLIALDKNKENFSTNILATDISKSVGGSIILFLGFLAFNAGCVYSLNLDTLKILLNTLLAGGGGVCISLLLSYVYFRNFNVLAVLSGLLGGLVFVTSFADIASPLSSVISGLIAGGVTFYSEKILIKLKIDDPISVLPVHLFAGLVGILFAAFLMEGSLLKNFAIQVFGIFVAFIWYFVIPFIIFYFLNKYFKLRINDKQEEDGLNISEHGATTELSDMYKVMDIQQKTGNMAIRLNENKYTTIGKIGIRYNKVLSVLEEEEKSGKKEILDNIFGSVNEGICITDKEFNLTSFYSNSLLNIFNLKGSIDGKRFKEDLLTPFITKDISEEVDMFFELFKKDKINMKTISKISPLHDLKIYLNSIEKEETMDEKILNIDIRKLQQESDFSYLITISDITQEVKLQKEVMAQKEKSNEEMKLLYKIINLNPIILDEFLDESLNEISKMKLIFEKSSQFSKKNHGDLNFILKSIYRGIHTIKGSSNVIDFESLTQELEEIEEKISEAKNTKDVDNTALLNLLPMIVNLENKIKNISVLRNRINSFYQQNKVNEIGENQTEEKVDKDILVESVRDLVTTWSDKFKKKIKCIIDQFNYGQLPKTIKRNIKDILIQLARNSIYHGIELPEERIQNGKGEWGNIKISSRIDDNQLKIVYEDDGSGIDIKKVKNKAIENGLDQNEVNNWDENETIEYLFKQGVSTAEETNEIAGKGVGMDVIKDTIENLKGTIDIQTKLSHYFKANISIPIA